MSDGKLTALGAAYITKVALTLALSIDYCAHTQDKSSLKWTEFVKRETIRAKANGKGALRYCQHKVGLKYLNGGRWWIVWALTLHLGRLRWSEEEKSLKCIYYLDCLCGIIPFKCLSWGEQGKQRDKILISSTVRACSWSEKDTRFSFLLALQYDCSWKSEGSEPL